MSDVSTRFVYRTRTVARRVDQCRQEERKVLVGCREQNIGSFAWSRWMVAWEHKCLGFPKGHQSTSVGVGRYHREVIGLALAFFF